MFQSKAELLKSLEVLRGFFNSLPDGAIVSWVEIEQGSGVSMRKVAGAFPGRDLARRALNQLKRPYSAMIGSGIELSHDTTAGRMGNQKVNSMRRKIGRTHKALGVIATRHAAAMPAEERQLLQHQLTVTGILKGEARAIAPRKAPALPQPAADESEFVKRMRASRKGA